MDFDPGFHEEMYDDGQEMYEEDLEHSEEEMELDSLGNPIFLATAAGFGRQMGKDSLEERQIAERILRDREGKGDPVKIPLADRGGQKKVQRYTTPFGRWARKVNEDPTRRDEDIEYTKEEQLKILKAEGD